MKRITGAIVKMKSLGGQGKCFRAVELAGIAVTGYKSEKLAEPGGSSHSKILIYEAKSFESFN